MWQPQMFITIIFAVWYLAKVTTKWLLLKLNNQTKLFQGSVPKYKKGFCYLGFSVCPLVLSVFIKSVIKLFNILNLIKMAMLFEIPHFLITVIEILVSSKTQRKIIYQLFLILFCNYLKYKFRNCTELGTHLDLYYFCSEAVLNLALIF